MEAGWYEDPDDGQMARWFDGTSWAEHTVAMTEQDSPSSDPDPATPAPGSDTPAAPGPGWWLASDRRWYPPTSAASPVSADAPPPSRGHRQRAWLWVAVLAVIGVVAAVVIVLVNRGTSDKPDAAARPTTTTIAGRVATTRAGAVSLTLPLGWRGADVSGGVQGVGAKLFPDDPSVAATIEQRMTVLPRAVLIFGVRKPDSTTGFADNVNVLSDPTVPAGLSLEQVGELEAKSLEQFATIGERGVVDLGTRRAFRVTYKNEGIVQGVTFIIKGRRDTWVLTYSFGSDDRSNVDRAGTSATTFVTP